MSPVFIASGVVIVACIAFMAVGAVYRWDPMSPGFGRWTRAIGAVALVMLAVVAVWDRLHEPMVALAAVVSGTALASGFVWAHRTLSARLEGREDPGSPPGERG